MRTTMTLMTNMMITMILMTHRGVVSKWYNGFYHIRLLFLAFNFLDLDDSLKDDFGNFALDKLDMMRGK